MHVLPKKITLKVRAYLDEVHRRWLQPRASDEDEKRREFIFNVLLLGSIALTFVASMTMVIGMVTKGPNYEGQTPLLLFVPVIILGALYGFSRRHFSNVLPYIFVLLFMALGTYGLYSYGYVLPEGLLGYALVIVMAGILISVRAAWIMMALIIVCLGALDYIQTTGVTHPDLSQRFDPLNAADIVVYTFVFVVMLLVSWLSNREIEHSLQRALHSEAELRNERNSLEVKIRERTRELERAQVEKMLEQHRFAEFGRLSSTLLHEIANPLTAVSLELEQLKSKKYSKAINQARKSISYMEQYVEAARRQLRNQSDIKIFDSALEIKRVTTFLEPKARSEQVRLEVQLMEGCKLQGDSTRFDQILANLIVNAIDAYSDLPAVKSKKVIVSSMRKQQKLEIHVQDFGIGIAAGEMTKIFEPFYTTKGSHRGTGIGLSITKRVVEEDFGGIIKVRSSKRSGTLFSVSLPLHVD